MGLFKKTLSDVEKFRSAGDAKKLCESLEARDPDVAQAALRALQEMDLPGTYADMAGKVAVSPYAELKREFEAFVALKGDLIAKPIAEALIGELKRLVLAGALLLDSARKQVMEGQWPGGVRVIEGWLSGIRDAALPELRERLGHEVFLARVLCAQILDRWNDADSRERRCDVLERWGIVCRKLEFDTKPLLGAMEPGEVPLGRASVCTLKNKVFELGVYTLGLTDEAVHIVAEFGLIAGTKFGKWRIPVSRVLDLGFSSEGRLTIEIDAPVRDPEDLNGPETTRLSFKPFKKKDVARATRIVEIWTRLKPGTMSKTEIADKLYDQKLVTFMDF